MSFDFRYCMDGPHKLTLVLWYFLKVIFSRLAPPADQTDSQTYLDDVPCGNQTCQTWIFGILLD